MVSWKRIIKPLILGVLTLTGSPAVAYATGQSSSPNYSVDQVYFGTGGELNACSTSYCSKQSAGDLTVGGSNSPNYQIHAGSNTDRQPYLEFVVNTANIDVGVLTSSTTGRANATFSVKSYLSSGYVVQSIGTPPNMGKQSTATFNPTADTYVLSTSATTNFGSANPIFDSNTSYRSLLRFDLSSIPAGSSINSAALVVQPTTTIASGGMDVHPELDSWAENTVTWNTQPTWNASVLATSTSPVAGTSLTIPLPTSAITPGANNDFGLGYSVASFISRIASREDATNPPQLVVTYTDPQGTVMTAPSTPTASSSGTEQFGINLVANTSPATFGSNPAQIPNSTFSFGQAASGYNTPNLYKYVNGDTVASSSSSSGETDYTISYIFNISSTTPGGTYTMNHVLVATSTF